jgi:hypothetical protein
MNFCLTPQFSEKVFKHVGKIATDNLDLTLEHNQIQFCRGFVESLEKEANMSPEMALGFIDYICDSGSEWLVQNHYITKEAAEELGIKDRIVRGVGNFLKPGLQPMLDDAATKGISNNVKQFTDPIKDFGGKAWNYIKNPEFLKNVAPLLIGGLAGAFIPKAFGLNGVASTGVGAVGGALAGKAIADTWAGKGQGFDLRQIYKDNAKLFRSGAPQTAPQSFSLPPANQSFSLPPTNYSGSQPKLAYVASPVTPL